MFCAPPGGHSGRQSCIGANSSRGNRHGGDGRGSIASNMAVGGNAGTEPLEWDPGVERRELSVPNDSFSQPTHAVGQTSALLLP